MHVQPFPRSTVLVEVLGTCFLCMCLGTPDSATAQTINLGIPLDTGQWYYPDAYPDMNWYIQSYGRAYEVTDVSAAWLANDANSQWISANEIGEFWEDWILTTMLTSTPRW